MVRSSGTAGKSAGLRKEAVPNSFVVVDDSPTILYLICSLLEHHKIGRVIGTASGGVEAIERVRRLKPDFVLMDADMPEMSGLRTALVLSQFRPETRIMLMSMDSNEHFRAGARACGADLVIYKPRFLSELSSAFGHEMQHNMGLSNIPVSAGVQQRIE